MASPRQIRMTFRQEDSGGGVLDRPKVCPGKALTGQRYLVLLIHGFNNSKSQAQEAYDGFKALQRELGNLNPDQPITQDTLVEFYWPGDVGWISAMNYEASLQRAIAIARRLPGGLRRAVGHDNPLHIDVVAHSMGCRLVLEMIRHIRAYPNIVLRRAAFMAAAVPTFLLEPTERLRAGLDRSTVEKVMSLFSIDDWVLGNAFPAGQWDAQGERWTEGDEYRRGSTVALGHECWISSYPSSLLSQDTQTHIEQAGHSDYWGYKNNTQGHKANALVKDFLGFSGAGSRKIVDRERGDRESSAARTTGPNREPPSRYADGSEGDQCIEV